MTELLTWLTTLEGSLIVGGLIVALVVQGYKWIFKTLPGDEAWEKRAAAIVAAIVVAGASAALSGEPLTWGGFITTILSALAGATAWHAAVLRSPEAKAPGKPQDETD